MHSKQTKIICTLADNRCEPEFIQELVDNGMNVVRLNTAHLTVEAAGKMVKTIRSVSDRIGILIDTKGPEVRTCDMDDSIVVQTGDRVCITNNPSKPGDFKVNYPGFVGDVAAGKIEACVLCVVEVEGAQRPCWDVDNIRGARGGQNVARRRQVKQRREAAGPDARHRLAHRRAGHDGNIERCGAVARRLCKAELRFDFAQLRFFIELENEQRGEGDQERACQGGETARAQRVNARGQSFPVQMLLLIRHFCFRRRALTMPA